MGKGMPWMDGAKGKIGTTLNSINNIIVKTKYITLDLKLCFYEVYAAYTFMGRPDSEK